MAGPTRICTPLVDTPPGAQSFHLTWTRDFRVTYDINDSIAVWLDAIARVRSAGGTVIDVIFYDGAGNNLGDGGMCTTVVTPPPPPPAPPPPPPPAPPPDLGDGDELSIGFGQLMLELQVLIDLIQKLTASPGQVDYTACCHAIIVALQALVKIVEKVEARLSLPGSPPPPPIDLSVIITELTCICESSRSSAAATASIAQNLPPSLRAIADAITKQTGTDVSQIVEQLKTIATQGDVPPTIMQALQQLHMLTSSDLQTLSGSPWSHVITYIESLRAVRTVEKWADEMGADAAAVGAAIKNKLPAVGNWAENLVLSALTMERNVIQQALEVPLAQVLKALTPNKPTSIGNVGVNPDTVLADVVSLGINLWVLLALVGMKFPGTAEQLEKVVEATTGVLGFEELKEVQIGPFVNHGIRQQAEMQAKNIFRQDLPGPGTLANLVARGLWDVQRYSQTVGYTGLPTELIEPMKFAAETGLQPFILLRLAGTGLFTDRDLVDEMTFRGVRPASQHRILLAAPFVASQKERDALRGTLEKAYAGGLFADVDFTDRINALEQETDRPRLILERAKLERALGVLKEIENAYETEFLAGITDAPTYQSKLQGLGLQLDYVTGMMAKAEAHANARLVRQAAAAERALVKATAAEERRAALTQYQAGTLNEAGLAAGLVATGLTPIQAAAWVAQALGQRAGKLRLVYGLRLSPAESTLLRQRVADLMKQRELQMLTDNQFVLQLQALKIPPTFVNALRAGANAALKPKTAAVLTPVATS